MYTVKNSTSGATLCKTLQCPAGVDHPAARLWCSSLRAVLGTKSLGEAVFSKEMRFAGRSQSLTFKDQESLFGWSSETRNLYNYLFPWGKLLVFFFLTWGGVFYFHPSIFWLWRREGTEPPVTTFLLRWWRTSRNGWGAGGLVDGGKCFTPLESQQTNPEKRKKHLHTSNSWVPC